tara:strand:+ start:188 stop:415 length:228 start_codon:yes stop_codon:yes gene_type:complete
MKQETKKKMFELFGKVYEDSGNLFSPLENDKTKTKNIQALKDYMNTNVKLYELNIVFLGGLEQDYRTAIKVKLIN